jgi:molybdate transport system ATP-binding protein
VSSAATPRYRDTRAGKTLDVYLLKRYTAYKDSAFQLQVEFSIAPGITIVLGHSGAGKSTLLHCIAGLCGLQEGRISAGGRVLFDAAQAINVEPARRNIGFVFQDLALFPHLTVEENVAYGLRKLPPADRQQKISRVLESFHIAHLQKRLPRAISGGEQQRVALARSLVTEPCVLLLDEPLSSLDAGMKTGIIDDMRRWNEEHEIPILYVTHDQEEVRALGDNLFTLDHGRIVSDRVSLNMAFPSLRALTAVPADFENILDATVVEVQKQEGTMVCRIAGTSVDLTAPLAPVTPGAQVRLGIRAGEILLASSRPEMVGHCNLIRVDVRQLQPSGQAMEARVDCGAEFRVHLRAGSAERDWLRALKEAWMIIRAHSCHVLDIRQLNSMQRLFVFVCGGNTVRSPMAEAICNAEVARLLKMPLEASRIAGITAISAGLAATPGEAMTVEAQQALGQLSIPTFSHRSQNLSAEMAARAEAIFCMTRKQCQMAMQLFPKAASKIFCLHPDADLEEPDKSDPEAFPNLAVKIQALVYQRLTSIEGIAQFSSGGS